MLVSLAIAQSIRSEFTASRHGVHVDQGTQRKPTGGPDLIDILVLISYSLWVLVAYASYLRNFGTPYDPDA